MKQKWAAQTLVRDFTPRLQGEVRRIASDLWWWGLYNVGMVGVREYGDAPTRRLATIRANRAAFKLGRLKRGSGLSR